MLKRFSFLTFLLLAYVSTWGILLPLVLQPDLFVRAHGLAELIHAAGAVGPAGAALILVLFLSRASQQTFWNNFRWKKPHGLVVLLAISPAWLFGLELLVQWVGTGELFDFSVFADRAGLHTAAGVVLFLAPPISYGIFEEIGWRGFALPSLQKQMSAFVASAALAIFWAFSHFPMFFYRFDYGFWGTLGLTLGLAAGTFLLTALYNSSRGSIWPTIIWHVLWNVLSLVDPSGLSVYLSIGTLVLTLLVILIWKPATLSLTDEKVVKEFR